MNSEKQTSKGTQVSIRAKDRGFTVVELVVTTVVIAILASIATSSVLNFRENQNFKQDAQLVAESMRFAQEKARLGEGGVAWGIRFSSEEDEGFMEIFSGVAYSTSTVVERRNLSPFSRFGNPPEGYTKTISFTALSGLPSTAHTIILRKVSSAGDLYVVSLSALGKITASRESDAQGVWELDEGTGTTAHDASGQGKTGTLENFAFSGLEDWVSLGKSGAALSTTGSPRVIDAGTAISPSTQGTFMAWVYPRSISSERRIIDKRNATSAQDGYALFFSGTDMYFAYGNGSSYFRDYKDASAQYTADTWHHVAVTLSGTTVTYYIDGASLGTHTGISGGIATNNISMGIGYSIGASSGGFEGILDDLRVYSRALSDDEIQMIYEAY